MASLSTHVLDTIHGKPAEGIVVELHRVTGVLRQFLKKTITNKDGRPVEPLCGGDLESGVYELTFLAGDYFKRTGLKLPNPPFFEEVIVRFGISDRAAHYHVPLLLSAYGYTTYRGS